MKTRLIAILITVGCVFLTGCHKEKINELYDNMADITSRVESLELWQKEVNSDIEAIQTLIDALESKNFISGVEETANGYKISLQNGQVLTINHGNDGDAPPQIGISLENGVYYWTLDGEFILDEDENKLPVTGKAPKVRINPDSGEWEISVDNGQNWSTTGVVAEGIQGEQGDSFFNSVDSSNADYVVFTLSDNTEITIPRTAEISISFGEAGSDVYSKNLVAEEGVYSINVFFSGLAETDYTGLYAELMNEDGQKFGSIVTRTSSLNGVEISKPVLDNASKQLVSKVTFNPEFSGGETAVLKVTVVTDNGKEVSSTCMLAFASLAIKDAAGLLALDAAIEACTSESFYFCLDADIDMTDQEWLPVDIASLTVKNIVMDGQGHTIKGLNNPLFQGNSKKHTIKRLTIEDATINGTDSMGAFVAYPSTSLELSYCKAINCKIESTNYAGAFAGYIESSGNHTFDNCVVDGCEIKGNSIGGFYAMVGAGGNNTVTNGVVKNSSLNNVDDGVGSTKKTGYLVSTVNGGINTFTNNTESGNTYMLNGGEEKELTWAIGRVVGNLNGTTFKVTIDGTPVTEGFNSGE